MGPLYRSRPVRAATATAFLATAAVGFVPLFGGPGYEAAFASGLILPSLAAFAVALEVSRARPVPFEAYNRGAATGALLGLTGLSVTFAHGLRTGFCDPLEGAAFYLLGPGLGAILGGVWGAVVGVAATASGRAWPRPLLFAAAIAGPAAGIAVSLWRFYASPMVFAFDPFFGFFAGTLYDTVITGLDRLATYRIGSACTLLAAAVLFSRMRRDADGQLRVNATRWGLTLVGVAAAAGSFAITWAGPDLGHYQTTESIQETLGRSAIGKRCEVIYPTEVLKRDAHALARDCDGHVEQLEKYFEARGPDRITVYLFASAAQKGYLMGASHVYIAKPWRREIYIQNATYPHPVLRHELAHVVAGSFGEGPFAVSGPLGGWIPDPGRIEGVAVAAAPKEDDLTLSQWAQAMNKLDLLPRLERVFKLSFFGEPSTRAYTVAGAFVSWMQDRYGIGAVKAWYGGARLSDVTEGKSLSALERDFRDALSEITVSEEAMHVAEARFDRPSVFERRCPHTVDRLAQKADWALSRLDTDKARELYGQLLRLDPHHVGARLGLSTCALRDGDVDRAKADYEKVANDDSLGKTTRARALESLGDVALLRGQASEAQERYDAVAELVVDDDHLRALDVKRYGAEHGDAREPILRYLIGDARYGTDVAVGAAALGAWSARDERLGLADYLLGRNFYHRGRWRRSAVRFDLALDKTLPLRRAAREALRSRLILACALGEVGRAKKLFQKYSGDPDLGEPRRRVMSAFIARCEATREP